MECRLTRDFAYRPLVLLGDTKVKFTLFGQLGAYNCHPWLPQ